MAYKNWLKPEERLQSQVGRWVQMQYPKLFWIHPPNEGKRTKYENYIFKVMGAKPGASDMIFFEARGGYHGLAIELKVKGGKVSPYQETFLNEIRYRGWMAEVCWSFEEAIELINKYMKL